MRDLKPGVHTNDFASIHGRRARIHTAPAESTVVVYVVAVLAQL